MWKHSIGVYFVLQYSQVFFGATTQSPSSMATETGLSMPQKHAIGTHSNIKNDRATLYMRLRCYMVQWKQRHVESGMCTAKHGRASQTRS